MLIKEGSLIETGGILFQRTNFGLHFNSFYELFFEAMGYTI